MDFTNYTTDCKAINWLISKVIVSDHSDVNGKYFIGEFKGNLNYRMREEIVAWFKSKGTKYSDYVYSPIQTEKETLTISARFGKFNSTAGKIEFYISYCAD